MSPKRKRLSKRDRVIKRFEEMWQSLVLEAAFKLLQDEGESIREFKDTPENRATLKEKLLLTLQQIVAEKRSEMGNVEIQPEGWPTEHQGFKLGYSLNPGLTTIDGFCVFHEHTALMSFKAALSDGQRAEGLAYFLSELDKQLAESQGSGMILWNIGK